MMGLLQEMQPRCGGASRTEGGDAWAALRIAAARFQDPWPGTDGNHSCRQGQDGAASGPPSCALSSWSTRPSMPPATVTTWPVTWPERTRRGEGDDLRGDVVGRGDLAQRHRPRDPATCVVVEHARGHRRDRPARCDRVHAHARVAAHHLVLQREQQAAEDRRLRGGVVGVARLADRPRRSSRRGRARPRGRRAGRGTRARSGRSRSGSRRASPASARARAPQTGTSSTGQTPATAAQTSSSPASANIRSTSASSRRSAWTTRAAASRPPPPARARGGSGRRPGALGGEQPDAGGADSARAAGDEHACP